jgi:hypothetical protein
MRARVHEVLANAAYVGEYYFNRIDGKTRKTKPASEWVKLAVDPIIEPAISAARNGAGGRVPPRPSRQRPRIQGTGSQITNLLG